MQGVNEVQGHVELLQEQIGRAGVLLEHCVA